MTALPFVQKLKFSVRQPFFAAIGFQGHVPLAMTETDNGAVVTVDGVAVHVPSPLYWKMFKYGWRARLDQLSHEYGLDRFFMLNEDSTVLDVGGNIGEFAILCSQKGAAVHSFEPDPKARACYLENTADCNKTHVHDLVIWKEDGEVEFGFAPDRADSSVFAENTPKQMKSAATIARFLTEQDIPVVDLLKCDAEGAEPEVLEGIGREFQRIKGVAFDTGAERHGERTHDACAAILNANGFRVFEEKIGTRWMTYGVRPTE